MIISNFSVGEAKLFRHNVPIDNWRVMGGVKVLLKANNISKRFSRADFRVLSI